jgi:ubiquinone/menaquinone biosynthesis C-methylase UbiE
MEKDNANREQFERKTRRLFHKLHSAQAENQYIFHRLTSLLSTEYLRVEQDFFHGKVCLDAGCGSNANATYAMLMMGAEKVYAFDLDESIFETVPKMLKDFAPERYDLRTGNVLTIDFADNTFDFVHCGGVLHHSADVLQGLKELARVTKPGGLLYVHTYGAGGLIREITSFFREKYSRDDSFRTVIDDLQVDQLRSGIKWILAGMKDHGDRMADRVSVELLEELIDDDLVLTIKDRITAPVYHEHSEEVLRKCLEGEGFTDIVRLTRYPHLKNIRRFLSPLYDKHDSDLARFLYGSGLIQLKALKKA